MHRFRSPGKHLDTILNATGNHWGVLIREVTRPNSHLLGRQWTGMVVSGGPVRKQEYQLGGYWNYLVPSTLCSITTSSSCSVYFSRSVVSDSLRPHGPQHARPPCPSSTSRAYSNSSLSHRWCHPTISSSVIPFSSCPQSFPASGSFHSVLCIRWPKY